MVDVGGGEDFDDEGLFCSHVEPEVKQAHPSLGKEALDFVGADHRRQLRLFLAGDHVGHGVLFVERAFSHAGFLVSDLEDFDAEHLADPDQFPLRNFLTADEEIDALFGPDGKLEDIARRELEQFLQVDVQAGNLDGEGQRDLACRDDPLYGVVFARPEMVLVCHLFRTELFR